MSASVRAHDTARKVRVLIVDDSAVMRGALTKILSSDPVIEVVGVASDAYVARKKIKALNPDVLTLDIEMPRMSGLDFLRNLMRLRPMPVVMVSSLTQRGAASALEALAIGAVDYVPKPAGDSSGTLHRHAIEIIAKVKMASAARVEQTPPAGARRKAPADPGSQPRPAAGPATQLVTIGASTGGTVAVREVLRQLGPCSAGVLIVQHITEAFAPQFVRSLDCEVAGPVCLAEHGQTIERGVAYVAPAEHHLLVERNGGEFRCVLSDAPPLDYHRPAVDMLMRAAAETAGRSAVGVLLTGMGSDGARGLAALRGAGAHTIAQDETTSVVWGMPRAAIELGAVEEVIPLDQIAARVRVFLAACRLGTV